MSTARQRLTAIDVLAARTGRTRVQVLSSLSGAWNLTGPEIHLLREAMAKTPLPKAPPPLDAEAAAAVDRLEQHMANADVAALADFNRYQTVKATNPHGATLMLAANPGLLRGRDLKPPTGGNPPPTPAAPPPAA